MAASLAASVLGSGGQHFIERAIPEMQRKRANTCSRWLALLFATGRGADDSEGALSVIERGSHSTRWPLPR